MIDLITLCDCLDAATDCYGRNYHQAKTVEQVLSEFERDSGVRYHPDLVRFLRNSPALIQELQTVVTDCSAAVRSGIQYSPFFVYVSSFVMVLARTGRADAPACRSSRTDILTAAAARGEDGAELGRDVGEYDEQEQAFFARDSRNPFKWLPKWRLPPISC